MTIPHVVAGFVSAPVAIVSVTGAVLALTFDPTIAAAAAVTVIVALTAGIVAILSKLGENKKASAGLAIELAKIARSVDGVASRQVDKIASLEVRVTDLLAQLAAEKNTASTLAATHAAVAVAVAAAPTVAPKVEP